MSLSNAITTRRCDRCKAPKSMVGGIQIQKMVGQRYAICYVCWDCVQLHYHKQLKEGLARGCMATQP